MKYMEMTPAEARGYLKAQHEHAHDTTGMFLLFVAAIIIAATISITVSRKKKETDRLEVPPPEPSNREEEGPPPPPPEDDPGKFLATYRVTKNITLCVAAAEDGKYVILSRLGKRGIPREELIIEASSPGEALKKGVEELDLKPEI